MIDRRFVFKVADYMLPKPTPKKEYGPFDDERAESLKELKIIVEGFRCC